MDGFEIIMTPEGKFTLRWDKGQVGPFSSKVSAEEAMRRVINPEVYRYNGEGKPV